MDALVISTESTDGTLGGQYVLEVALVAGPNTITPASAPNPGDLLAVRLTTPASGLATIVWDASFLEVTVNDIDVAHSLNNNYLFSGGSDGNWHLVSMILGRP